MHVSREATTLADDVRRARTEKRPVPSGLSPIDLDEAYQVQRELGEGRDLVGYKLGLLSPQKQAQMGINAPVYGRIYSDMLLDSPVDLGSFIQPKMEPEVAVVLGEDVPAGASPTEARNAVESAFLGIDFLDTVWQGYRFTISDVVADNTSGGGFLRGDEVLENPYDGRLELYLDGENVAEGEVRDLGDVGERLSWLAGEVGRASREGLKAGHVVFLGSPVAAVGVRAGALELRGPGGSVLAAQLRE